LIFRVAAIFLLPVSPLQPPRRPFLPYFCPCSPAIGARWYKWTFYSKPCAYCRIVRSSVSSVCLSVCHVTFCITAKWYVLAKNCLKEQIGNQGQKVDFLGRRHISTSGFASTATETTVFALFLPVQPSDRYWMVQADFLAANHVCIVTLCSLN